MILKGLTVFGRKNITVIIFSPESLHKSKVHNNVCPTKLVSNSWAMRIGKSWKMSVLDRGLYRVLKSCGLGKTLKSSVF